MSNLNAEINAILSRSESHGNQTTSAGRCASARGSVQGNDGMASRGLMGRMQGARAIKDGSRNNNPGSRAFAQMQAENSANGMYTQSNGSTYVESGFG
jgi:hypothetical protein